MKLPYRITGIMSITFTVLFLSPHLMLSASGITIARAQQNKLTELFTLTDSYYQEQLYNKEVESTHVRFWRKHRSYPHHDRALRLAREGRTNEAIEVYNRYLVIDPDHVLMRWNRLILLSKTTAPSEVIDAATDFLDRVPGYGPALMIRAFAHHRSASFEGAEKDFASALLYKKLLKRDRKKILAQLYSLAYRRTDFIRSKEIARKLTATYPDNALFREYYAQALYRLSDFEKSEEQWHKVQRLSADPFTKRRAAISRLTILEELGRYEAADKILAVAKRQTLFSPLETPPPLYLDFLRLKGTVSGKLGRRKMSKTSFEEALSLLEDRSNALSVGDLSSHYQSIGNAAFDAKLYPVALRAYTNSLKCGEDPTIRVKASETSWQLKKYDQTVNLLRPLVFGKGSSASPISANLARRLCMAYEKQGFADQSLDCFDKLVPRYADNVNVLAEAARAAGRNGHVERQIDLLRRYHKLKPSADMALRIGYLYTEMDQHKSASKWFQFAYRTDPSADSGMAYANSLLSRKNGDTAVNVIKNVLQSDTLQSEKEVDAYRALGTAYMQQDRFHDAAEAYGKALEISSNPVWNIYRAGALRKSGHLKSAEVLFSAIPVELLSPEAQLEWYDEAGELFHRTGRLEECLNALREGAAMNSSYKRQLGLSMLLLKMERFYEAEERVNIALAHKPGDIVALRHKAFILAAKGDNLGAVEYMERINEELPRDFETLQSLGFLYLKLGRYEASNNAFRQAINATEISEHSESAISSNRLKDLKTAQNHMAELNRRFRYSLTQSVHMGENERRTHGVLHSDNAFTQAYGAVEIAYRPHFMGFRPSRLNEIYSSFLWTQDDTESSEDNATTQGQVGFRVIPFDSTNLVFSAETVFPGDDDLDTNALLRISHSFSRMPWHNTIGNYSWFDHNTYLHTYFELGKAFFNEEEFFGNVQARIGRSAEMNGRLYLSPFIYLLSNGYKNEDKGNARGQAGIGMAVDFFSGYHRYKGYRRHLEFLMRVGLDFDRRADNAELNGLAGLKFVFF